MNSKFIVDALIYFCLFREQQRQEYLAKPSHDERSNMDTNSDFDENFFPDNLVVQPKIIMLEKPSLELRKRFINTLLQIDPAMKDLNVYNIRLQLTKIFASGNYSQ